LTAATLDYATAGLPSPDDFSSMAKTFAQKMRLAIADPKRVGRSLSYRSVSLFRAAIGVGNQTEWLDQQLIPMLSGGPGAPAASASQPAVRIADPLAAMSQRPLMRGARTYNTAHPDFHSKLVRSYPGYIFNRYASCNNRTYAALSQMARSRWVPDRRWTPVLAAALAEASEIPGAQQLFERRRFVEDYVTALAHTYRARYNAGWVNLQDALFLYWLVRRARPRTIVQTGVCNGLSAAFMMLALAKNGPDGTLHVIDLAPVFDPNDPAWMVEGELYGVVIPEGKTTGWLVPDIYRDRFEVWNGDAKELLPKMVDKLGALDFFYHDSDHTYDHMMFEFHVAKRKLTPGGLIVGDDMLWNASLWDFADEFRVPAYNFKGTVGVAFF
jgi:predicted O-methyltransferase YrrM